jgi:hypothetical protein
VPEPVVEEADAEEEEAVGLADDPCSAWARMLSAAWKAC